MKIYFRQTTTIDAPNSAADDDERLTDRVRKFNVELNDYRRRALERRGGLNAPWLRNIAANATWTLWGAEDDYMAQLARFPHVITAVLPWKSTSSRGAGRDRWSSLSDFSNVLIQEYFQWTADERLCAAIRTPGATNRRYDAIFNRSCTTSIADTAAGQPLKPLYLNGKPIDKSRGYWPNDGNAYPAHFYASPPPFVLHLHLLPDAIVTEFGVVYSGDLKLVLYACVPDYATGLPYDGGVDAIPLYDELFVITQLWGTEVYHRMVDIVPRIAAFVRFLSDNPGVRILAPERPGGRLGELLRALDVDESRLVVGPARAKLVYLPRATGCGFANVQETQLVAAAYQRFVERTVGAERRNHLVLVSRSRFGNHRQFVGYERVEKTARRVADEYRLEFAVFGDDRMWTLNETMWLFHSAVMVVGTTGAGLSNLLFARRGTYVVEGVCKPQEVNLCFAYLSHVLGHHWHGLASTSNAEDVVDVSAADLEAAMRRHLDLWKASGGRN